MRARRPSGRIESPSFDEAAEASKHYVWFQSHIFPTCFVCGPGRRLDDGMRLYPGTIPERSIVATPWKPDASMPSEDKRIRDEIVWAALDCTSFFPHHPADAVLGRLHAQILRETKVGHRYVVVGWKVGSEGRKLSSGTAVFDEDGNACASALATWIQLQPDQAAASKEQARPKLGLVASPSLRVGTRWWGFSKIGTGFGGWLREGHLEAGSVGAVQE